MSERKRRQEWFKRLKQINAVRHKILINSIKLLMNYIKDFTGSAHSFRIGAEVKPTPEIAVRAGYGITSSPERYYENNVKKTPSTFKRSFAAGLGYSSHGSFFFDLAVRGTRNPVEYI